MIYFNGTGKKREGVKKDMFVLKLLCFFSCQDLERICSLWGKLTLTLAQLEVSHLEMMLKITQKNPKHHHHML